MTIDTTITLDTMSEADLEPVLELLRGRDPDTVARKSGVSRTRLLQLRDNLLTRIEQERARILDPPPEKNGRNAPCPCGSGKKYKHCCLNRHEPRHESAGQAKQPATRTAPPAKKAKQEQLIAQIEKTFDQLRAGRYGEAIDRASLLLDRYPDEDRLHDILATARLHAGQFDQAIDICEKRMVVAESEKSFFIEHGRYRNSEIDQPALSYFYPPLTWLQKTWIALKARAYNDRYPTRENASITEWISALKTADDASRFPTDRTGGLDLRRKALAEPIQRLKAVGPDVVPSLRPLAWKYSWSGLFVPEILSVYPTPMATRTLIDISMFGFSYASGASLHYLEKRGPAVIPAIRRAFSTDRRFDPIKTGIVSVLGNIRNPEAYDLLLDLLAHESPHVVNWAGDALGKFEVIDALPAMEVASQKIGGQRMIDRAIRRLKDVAKATASPE
jgi:hypothetical protein